MHAFHGAVAVRRERQKRRERRLSKTRQIRAGSAANSEQSMQCAGSDRDGEEEEVAPPKSESSLTAFGLGVVFILLGFILVFSSMVPRDVVDADVSKLLGIGTTLIMVGLLMVMVNRIISQREEEELAKYVGHRLGRTRSGHALGARDLEAGGYQHRHRQALTKTSSLHQQINSGKQQGQHQLLLPRGAPQRRSFSGHHHSRSPSIVSARSRGGSFRVPSHPSHQQPPPNAISVDSLKGKRAKTSSLKKLRTGSKDGGVDVDANCPLIRVTAETEAGKGKKPPPPTFVLSSPTSSSSTTVPLVVAAAQKKAAMQASKDLSSKDSSSNASATKNGSSKDTSTKDTLTKDTVPVCVKESKRTDVNGQVSVLVKMEGDRTVSQALNKEAT